jgi:hypothetical protein
VGAGNGRTDGGGHLLRYPSSLSHVGGGVQEEAFFIHGMCVGFVIPNQRLLKIGEGGYRFVRGNFLNFYTHFPRETGMPFSEYIEALQLCSDNNNKCATTVACTEDSNPIAP